MQVQTPSHFESNDDETYDEVTQGDNVEGEELDEEETNEEEEVNELYKDVNVNLEGRDTKMTDALLANSTSLVDVPVITNVEMPPSSITTLPQPPIPLIQPLHQTSVPTLTIVPNKLRDEAQAENEDFINKLDENIKKIIKKQVKEQVTKILLKIEKSVNEQLEAEVLIHTVTLKRRRDDEDDNEEPSDGSNWRSNRRRAGKEPKSTSAPQEKTSKSTSKSKEWSKSHQKSIGQSAQAEEPIHTVKDLEELAHQEFDTGFTEDQPVDETTQLPDWFQKPTKPLTPNRDWNKTLPAFVELEYFLEEVCKATTIQLDWNNPKGHQYPHDLRKPLPLIPNSRGCRVIPFDHFINNDLAYLSGGVLSQTYATSLMKTKAADYGHIKWIKDLVPNTMWSQVPIVNDKHALWGISHWGRKCQQFYGYAVNRESSRDVYSRNRIIRIKKLMIVEWHNYKHLEWITIRRDDDKLYTFKEDDYNRHRLQDIEDMLLLLKHCHQKACGRSSIEDRKLPKEAQPHKARYNKDKKNRLMRIDELQKFSDGTLNDVRSALDDTLKRIRMKYLPQTI
ncbi:hypothetical protein Tco_0194900 [Tanacetum coccineum]